MSDDDRERRLLEARKKWTLRNVPLQCQGFIKINRAHRIVVGYDLLIKDLRIDEINALLKMVYARIEEEDDACEAILADEQKRLARQASAKAKRIAKTRKDATPVNLS